MVYAQVKNGVIVNTIELEDASLLNLFQNDPATGVPYDLVAQVDAMYPQPGKGWLFDGIKFYTQITPDNNNPPPASQAFYQALVQEAMDFGNMLIVQAAAQNVSMGITQLGKTLAMMNYTSQLIMCLNTGSLYEAINQINIMIADTSDAKTALYPFISNDNLNTTKHQIQSWLGIPQT